MISKADFPKLQKPDDAMQVTDPRTGETGYRVGVEVFHQLHCLNLLRMSTYPEYYTKLWWSDTNDKPEKVRMHLGKSFLPCASTSMSYGRVRVDMSWDDKLTTTRPLHRDSAHEPDVSVRCECVYVPSQAGQRGVLAGL
jgi:hypothetical protein